MNNCSGLYLSTGNNMTDVPGQQIQHFTWMPVEQSPSFTQTIGFTFNQSVCRPQPPGPLMTYGASTLVLEPVTIPDAVQRRDTQSGTSISWPPTTSWSFHVPTTCSTGTVQLTVTTDPNLNSIVVKWYGNEKMLNHYIAGHGPAVVTPPRLRPGRRYLR